MFWQTILYCSLYQADLNNYEYQIQFIAFLDYLFIQINFFNIALLSTNSLLEKQLAISQYSSALSFAGAENFR